MGSTDSRFLITRPCIPLVVSLMIGIMVGESLTPPFPAYLLFSAVFLLIVLPSTLLLFPSFSFWAGCFFFLVTGLFQTTLLSPQVNTPHVPSFLVNQQTRHLSGMVIQEPQYYPDRTRLIVQLRSYAEQGQDRPAEGLVLLGIKGSTKRLDRGDLVRFICRLRMIEGYHNPGGYDFEDRMARKGIRVSGFIEDPDLLVLSGPNQRSWPWQRLSLLRTRVSDWIDSKFLPPFNGLAQALLTGDQSKIPREIQDTFSRAGVSHLLAFSGLNLTLVGGLSYYLFRFLFSLSETLLLFINVRRWALIGTFFPVLGYTLLAGMSPSAARALLMVGTVIAALLLNKVPDLLNSLALAALILLLLSPDALFLPSFQLSFLAVWAIGALLPRLLNHDQDQKGQASLIRRGGFYLWEIFCVSLVCQLATSPVVSWWFHQLSLIGLLSNLILVPLTGILATPIGLLALIFAPIFSPLSSLLFWIMNLMLQWTLWLTRFFADLPLAYLTMPRPGYGEIAFYYLTLVFLFNWSRLIRPVWLVFLSSMGLVLCFLSPQIWEYLSPPFRATFLDVGHGSAVLIEFPEGQKMLIDGGGSFNPEFDLGERVVGPFLWDKKITRLETVVLTHPHPDHLNGLLFILSKFKVKEIWMSRQRMDSPGYQCLEDLIQQKKIPVVCPATGWVRFFSNVRIEVVNSPAGDFSGEKMGSVAWHRQNDDSLVLRLSYRGEHLLLPADIEAEAERNLLSRGVSLKSQLLQVPHHGSLSSSTIPFIEAVQPCYAVISGRPTSRFPLPHPEVVKRYLERGVTLFRTDRDGAVTFDLRPKGWEIECYRGRTLEP